jgi:serine/threonine protein kinase
MPPPPPRLPVHKVGEYEVVGHIGSGGMGAVYEGKHPVIGKRVAIKVLLPQFSEDAGALKRFFDEAKAVNAIRHRGIVDIFGMGQLPDGSHYLVMEYLEGQSFDQLLKARKALPAVEALALLEEVLEAVGAAHGAKIIHRDLKPSNLFLVDGGAGRPYVKLLDFGVAKLSADADGVSNAQASAIVGTPIYMSPEQISGKRAGPAADIYALGVMLFELIAGKPPFTGASLMAMMNQHMEAKPPRLTGLKPGTPVEIEHLVDRMLAKKPSDRPQDAEALRAEVASLRARLEGPAAPTLDEEVAPTQLRPSGNSGSHRDFDNTALPTDRINAEASSTAFKPATPKALISHSAATLVSGEVEKGPGFSAAPPPRPREPTDPSLSTRVREPTPERRRNPWVVYALATALGFGAVLLLFKLLG